MNKNAIANRIYAELFGGPAPAPAPPPVPVPRSNVPKSSSLLSQAGRYLGLKSESLVQKLERAQLDLEELEKRKAAGNSNVTSKKIIDLKVYIRGLKAKLGKPSKINNNSSLSRPINRRPIPIPISLSRSGIYEAYRKKRPSKNFMNALVRVGSVSNSRERADLYYELKSYGPKERVFQNAVNRYIEREKSRPKTNNKGRVITGGATVTGNGRGGQQIIFGGGVPGQAPVAAPYHIPVQAPSAAAPYPIQIPGQVAPYPIQMGGGGAPQISVKVNARGPNSGVPRGPNSVVTPPPSASQINMVQNAGGQVAIQKAATALKRANGNVNTAMRETGLPRHTFTNVKNLGGVNIAPRIAASVTRHKKRHTTKKKSSRRKVPKPSIRTNRIKKVVHKVPRKNLERFVLLWALRRKR
jgi:hypothetical protein